MPTVEINLTGPSAVHHSRSQSSQRTVGFYPEKQDIQSEKSQFILNAFPGLVLFGTASGKDRGMAEHKSILYKVTGTTLYSVAFDGTHTSLGTIAGTGRCIIEGIGDDIVIVSEGRAWQYASPTLTEITDVDLETPNSCAHLNSQMIYDGDGGRFGVSDVGDATSIDGLNYATAESNADNLLRVYAFNQTLYLMGEKTIEPWWNSGVGAPPFDRIEGGIMPVGLAAIYSASHNDNFLYFLGDDNKIYRISGTSKENISNIPLTHTIKDYLIVSDAIGYCFSFENQNFYMLIFPTADRSWCFSESAEMWFEPNKARYLGNSFANAYRKNLVADYGNGNIYELDLETFDENGVLVERFRDSGSIHGGLFKAPGKRIEFNRFELIMETGVGRLPSTADNRENPYVMLSISYDGGNTYSSEMWAPAGKMGDYIYKVEWHSLGSGYDIRVRVKVSDPNFWSIHSAAADLEIGV
jgi:hypothetical protein